ncbi:DUF4369 domain-containing protein [uncultured Psychroserpens sp.]|uniref:DUF4369 domain-containing protein n=1 Tax=uncultured Psychroserpens sp. TaxID=255436 RepID=UPI002633422C|nr:DUF4369 domain-containing protein [uncultured Psychroserpens sp.]
MKSFLAVLIGLILCSCANDKQQHNFKLKGYVKGLKKGTVYLQKQEDSTVITLDSLEVKGNPNFELHTNLEEPEVLYLKLDKNVKDEEMIVFFADTGTTEINSTLKLFNYNAKIKGSKQQEVLDDYLTMITKSNNRNLDMLQSNFEALKNSPDSIKDKSFQEQQNKFLRLKYSATINFALNNRDSEVAPYLAIYEVPNTSIRFLDTIYNALDNDIKASKYGKLLKDTIDKRKEAELN